MGVLDGGVGSWRRGGGFGDPDLEFEFDFDVLAVDSDLIAGDASRCRNGQYVAACDVEDGAVPRAGHLGALNLLAPHPERSGRLWQP